MGLVDVAHGEEIYPLLQPSRGGQGAAILDGTIHGKRKGFAGGKYNRTPIHAVDDKRSMWTYIVCVVWFKVLAMLVNVLVSPVINRIMHTNNELATHVILDPYIISYVLAGFFMGPCSVTS